MDKTVHDPLTDSQPGGDTDRGEFTDLSEEPGDSQIQDTEKTGFTGVSEEERGEPRDSEEIDFTDVSEGEPGSTIDAEQPESQEEDSSGESEEPEEPATETLSLHVHRTIATGRAVLSVITNSTDPYYRVEPNLDSLTNALPLLQQLYEDATAHWQNSPRYPESPEHKPQPPTRTQPRNNPPARASRQQDNAPQAQQASFL